jgi:hypothetical protein
MLTNTTEIIQNNKKVANSRGSREIFSRISVFYRFHRTTNSKAHRQKKKEGILFRQEENTYYKDTTCG